jgi:F0F1-type ATP synthase membrane subunit b/b'
MKKKWKILALVTMILIATGAALYFWNEKRKLSARIDEELRKAKELQKEAKVSLRVANNKAKNITQKAKTKRSKILENARNKKDEILDKAKRQEEKIKRQAKSMKTQAQNMLKREKNKLHDIFPKLKKFEDGTNSINRQYIQKMDVSGDDVKFWYENNSYEKVYPEFHVVFFNEYGFVTECMDVDWNFTEIKTGERKSQEKSFFLRFGDPVYYVLDITSGDNEGDNFSC